MNILYRPKLILFFIVFFAFLLRFYRVAQIPPSLSWDEVSIGYNAYTILKTGRDEHQRFMPFDTFIAYGDYKPPIPVYFTVPFIFFFGLNELSIRLPSVLSGTISVFLTYVLVKTLFGKEKNAQILALLSSFIMAISPWHINISRAGFEANIATMFLILGIVLLLKSRDKKSLLKFCWLPFVAAIYTFNSARYFAPFIGLGFVLWQKEIITKNLKQFVVGVLIAFLALVPILPHLLSKESRLRFTEVNIFSDSSIVKESNARIAADGNTWWAKIIHNRRIGYTRAFPQHYLDHFEPSFLFIKGD
jgi:4-amino-4-deoxy-L-arabinose transferase-like glycosyltransferase